MSSAESRPKPDHKIQLSHAAGVVQPAGSESKERPSTTTASQAESVLAAEKREYGTNTDLGERKRAEEPIYNGWSVPASTSRCLPPVLSMCRAAGKSTALGGSTR
jgi:hypothetical protein